MYNYPLGVMVHNLRCDVKEAICYAGKLGLQSVQFLSTYGACSPEEMVGEAKKEIIDLLKANNLCVSAICGDYGLGLDKPEKNPEIIEKTKRLLNLSKELDCGIVTTHIGPIPKDKNTNTYKIMAEACFELGTYAESIGAYFAIETGSEPATVLKGFLDDLSLKGLAVNYDPANLVMLAGDDPVAGVYTLKDYIIHAHAKDGKKLKNVTVEEIYADEMKHVGISFKGFPLGQGDVDYDNFLKALDDVGYRGYLVIEREGGETPKEDVLLAAELLRHKFKTL